MPMHDWTKVRAGTYHNFHLRWFGSIMDRLNAGLLPEGYYALAEQVVGRPIPDLIALQTSLYPPRKGGDVAVAEPRPIELPAGKPLTMVSYKSAPVLWPMWNLSASARNCP